MKTALSTENPEFFYDQFIEKFVTLNGYGLGGTPGSPLPPPGPSGCIISLAFSVIEFSDEKLL